jgi:hypothetical protein
MGTDKHLLIVGFGGPTPGCCNRFSSCPGEAYCFVSGIFGDNPARKTRVEEVVEHYKALGGFSRFNEITEAQAAAVGDELKRRGIELSISVGYDHWMPHIADKVAEMASSGAREFITLVSRRPLLLIRRRSLSVDRCSPRQFSVSCRTMAWA